VLLVADLEKRLAGSQIFVPPAPGNSGSAIGAAMLAWHQKKHRERCDVMPGSYWGPGFGRHAVKDILDNSKARYAVQSTSERKFDSTVRLLQAGKIVGWFQGRTEFGPRALGNRSLLASPWAPYVRENLNDFVKHREWFRPFAISVTEEDASLYFEWSDLCRSMNSLATLRAGVDVIPPDFCLPGGRVRLHVVSRRSNPLFWDLLKRFGQAAPASMLLNTSFNLAGEPLVARPHDAVRSYFCSGIDALVMENFLLSKATAAHVLAGEHAGARAS
jgi:carbamoyltransferase